MSQTNPKQPAEVATERPEADGPPPESTKRIASAWLTSLARAWSQSQEAPRVVVIDKKKTDAG